MTAHHMQDRIESLCQVKANGNIFSATGGVYLTANDIYKGIVLKECKLLCKKLKKEKTVHEHQERIETNALHIQATKGGDHTKLTSRHLTILLTWHQHAKVATMKKEDMLAAWVAIFSSGKHHRCSSNGSTQTMRSCWRHSPTLLRWPTLPLVTPKHYRKRNWYWRQWQ
jgi:hypothetical protein